MKGFEQDGLQGLECLDLSPGGKDVGGQASPSRYQATANVEKMVLSEDSWNVLFGDSDEFEEWEGPWKYSGDDGLAQEEDESGISICPVPVEERHEKATAAKRKKKKSKWTKEENKAVWECYLRSKPLERGYRKRMHEIWKVKNMRKITEQRLCDQRKQIQEKHWLEELEMEMIKRKVKGVNIDEVVEAHTGTERPEVEGPTDESDQIHEEGNPEERNLTEEQQAILTRIKEVMKSRTREALPSLKACDKRIVQTETNKVNSVAQYITTGNITDCNNLLYAMALVVSERLGKVGKGKTKSRKKEPYWKRRIENNIKKWRQDLSKLTEVRYSRTKLSEKERERMDRCYELRDKGIIHVINYLKQRITTGGAKIRRYNQRNLQYHQNNLFRSNQKQFYKELDGKMNEHTKTPDPKGSIEFWSSLWSEPVEHNKDSEWLKKMKEKLRDTPRQENVIITMKGLKQAISRMPNWKAAGPDHVQGFWFKKATSLHSKFKQHLQECVNDGHVPAWMTEGRTVLIMKDKNKGTVVGNYRPITCLPLMWKLLTSIFSEAMYEHLNSHGLLPNEQKGCRKNSRGTKDQLLIDKAILKNCRRRLTNLSMAWIDYRKAYDMVPHSWILECARMFGVAHNIVTLIGNSMENWKTVLTSNQEVLGTVDIKRGIFQGDSLSPLLFLIIMIPISLILRDMKAGYQLEKEGCNINHLLFMDDLKLYGKNSNQIDSLVQTVWQYSEDIGMTFGIDKCAVLELERGRLVRSEGIELPDGERMKEVDQEGYKYLGVLQLDKVMNMEMKESIRNEYIRRVKLICKSKLYAGNFITGMNAWAIGVMRYSGGIIDWTKEELQIMDRKTRKIMTLNRCLHPRSSVARLYMKRKEGGRGLISVEDCIVSERRGLHDYLKESKEDMLIGALKENVIEEGETKEEFEKRKRDERKKIWHEGKLQGQFVQKSKNIAHEFSGKWIRNGFLKKETEGMLFAAQEQALRTNAIKAKIDKQPVSPNCRLCGTTSETVMHLVSGCSKLAQKQYKRRHDNVAKRVHWELCKKHGMKCTDKWYEHIPTEVMENDTVELYWDLTIQTDMTVAHNRPDITLVEKATRKWTLIDIAVPSDFNVVKTEDWKVEKYQDLAFEVRRLHHVETAILPVVIGALGTVPRRLIRSIELLGISDIIASTQMTALLGTAGILRRAMNL